MILATDILVLTEGTLDPSKLSLAAKGTQQATTFTATAPRTTYVQSIHGYSVANPMLSMTLWTVTIQDTTREAGRMLVLSHAKQHQQLFPKSLWTFYLYARS
ncbi:MAG: hypothetical protein Q9192_001106 [Flavoplaca navasiana]